MHLKNNTLPLSTMKISIEGNIGSGKSSVLARLCKETRIPVFLEPVDDWKDWLTLFYENPPRWGMSFNTNVLLSFNEWKNNKFLSLYERSPISNRYVFTQLQYQQGRMNELELSLFDKLYKKLAWTPDVVIYIQTRPEVSMQRMKHRARECENEVPLEYLQAVHDRYETIFSKPTQTLSTDYTLNDTNCHVVIVDGNGTHDEVYAEVLYWVKKFAHYPL